MKNNNSVETFSGGVVCLDNVTKKYGIGDLNIIAVNNVSLTISKGEFVAIIGLTFVAIFANINSNMGEYSVMHPVVSSIKSVLKTVKIEGFI